MSADPQAACELPPNVGQDRPPILELRNVSKRFPGVLANDDVSASVAPGEVLALLGENGAGKSTLMNVAYGLLSASAGEIVVDGNSVQIRAPRDAIRLGIGMVHQHFMLVEPLTVTENIVLGMEPTNSWGLIDRAVARKRVVEISAKYGLKVDPDSRVMDLSVGMQQRVEILKALYRDARILILDEPTAVLTPQEVHELFQIVRELVSQGLAVVIITHKLDEVMAFADRILVMRAGRVVGETTPEECSEQSLARMMVGRDVVLKIDKGPAKIGEVVLDVSDLVVLDDRKLPALKGVSFAVHGGEVLGIAGVSGNGQRELVEAITGLRRPSGGTVSLKGRDITHDDARRTIAAGVSHVPEDRHRRGLVLEFDLVENVALGDQRREPFSKHGILNRSALDTEARARIKDYDVRTPNEHVAASNLSGGNQQKLVLARELGRNPELLVASQPTRGLDVGAIEFVHRRIIAERDSGKAVLLVSMELEEVMSLSDRILVMYEGRVVAEFEGGQVTEEELGLFMTGGGRTPTEPSRASEEDTGA
ncbi:MAG: ABC transporter ATP-binding protein [Actinobacteria bacterium HGW-Actinobacteria-7]|jgi:simple sugar transport system ATP-binding protein|nr:MAG: ABC transporter ATP-binding protein [Actinobacteria bacterium HGW-Actinobacteria-7]